LFSIEVIPRIMPKGYRVSCYREIKDEEALKIFGSGDSAIENAGGRFLSRGMAIVAHEAG
jgi:hypothetical protein